MRWPLMLTLLAQVALADEAEDWVRSKIAQQRKGLDGSAAAAPVWKEGPSTVPTLPAFVPPGSFAPLVKAVRSGVVNISTRNGGTSKSLGSGFVISSSGLVVTNSHVVARAEEISVQSAGGTQFAARLIGRDEATDLALLKIAPDASVTPVTLGDSDALTVGDWVLAIGNPFGLEMSVTHGIVSARERDIGIGAFDDLIQTNALINPGNSGGPLFDMKGQVIGVTTAITTKGQGISFAVPINLVKDLLPNLLDDGRIERGWLGLTVREVDGPNGAHSEVVDRVFPDGPAARAGILAGDAIETIQGAPVGHYQQLLRRIALQPPGTVLKLGLRSAGKKREVEVTLRARPAAAAVQALASQGRIDSIGLTLAEGDAGLVVAALAPRSGAELAGLKLGDVIVEINQTPVTAFANLPQALVDPISSQFMLVKFRRGDTDGYLAIRMK